MGSEGPKWEEFNLPYTKTLHRTAYNAIDPTNPVNSVSGKVVIVTGGGSGIGKATAAAFIKAGAKAVTILGRRKHVLDDAKNDLLKSGSAQVLAIVADIESAKSLESAFQATEDAFGKVDIVVQNAGFLNDCLPVAESEENDWWKSFEINVKGVFLTFKAFLAHKSSNSPTFISMNTAISHYPGFMRGVSSYGVSKMASAHLVGWLAGENPDVTAISLHPGALPTDMFKKSGGGFPIDDISLPSSMIVWLSSPAAKFLSGRFVWSHWDVEELVAMKEQILANNELVMVLNGWPKQYAK